MTAFKIIGPFLLGLGLVIFTYKLPDKRKTNLYDVKGYFAGIGFIAYSLYQIWALLFF